MTLTRPQTRSLAPAMHAPIQQQLQELMSINGVYFVMLCSSDGFEIMHLEKKKLYNTGRLAAVSSSILAMISAFLKEIQLSGCQSVTLDADNAKAILSNIPSTQTPLVLVTLAESHVLLGQLLHTLKKTNQAIQTLIES